MDLLEPPFAAVNLNGLALPPTAFFRVIPAGLPLPPATLTTTLALYYRQSHQHGWLPGYDRPCLHARAQTAFTDAVPAHPFLLAPFLLPPLMPRAWLAFCCRAWVWLAFFFAATCAALPPLPLAPVAFTYGDRSTRVSRQGAPPGDPHRQCRDMCGYC